MKHAGKCQIYSLKDCKKSYFISGIVFINSQHEKYKDVLFVLETDGTVHVAFDYELEWYCSSFATQLIKMYSCLLKYKSKSSQALYLDNNTVKRQRKLPNLH